MPQLPPSRSSRRLPRRSVGASASTVLLLALCAGVPAGLAAGTVVVAAPEAASVDLTTKFVSGQKIKFKTEGSRSENSEIPGKTVASSSKYSGVVELNVTEVNDEGTTLTLTIESIKGELVMPEGTFVWDSGAPADDKDANNPAYRAYRPVVGFVSTFLIGKNGEMKVSGAETLNTPQEPWLQHVQVITMNEQARARWSRILMPKEAGGATKVGESWTDVDEQPSPVGKFSLTTERTLSAVKDGVAEIAYKGGFTLAGATPEEKPAMEIPASSITGEVMFDTAKGLPIKGKTSQMLALDGNPTGLPIKRKTEWSFSAERMP